MYLSFSVHPHVSGEHICLIIKMGIAPGSSPREWGTLDESIYTRVTTPVHPHVSGEHGANGDILVWEAGSSPREWGTHEVITPVSLEIRFIPT